MNQGLDVARVHTYGLVECLERTRRLVHQVVGHTQQVEGISKGPPAGDQLFQQMNGAKVMLARKPLLRPVKQLRGTDVHGRSQTT